MIQQVSFGESHKVVGGHPCLGDWDVSNAPQMQWNDGNVWTLDVQLPEGSDIEFKVKRHCYCYTHHMQKQQLPATFLACAFSTYVMLLQRMVG